MAILTAQGISKTFLQNRGLWGSRRIEVLKNISFELPQGKTIGIVGESGCGKSTLAKILCGLLDCDSGEIFFEDEKLTMPYPKHVRAKIQMIFQDPYGSLNPRMRLGKIVEEPLVIHGIPFKERKAQVEKILLRLGFHVNDCKKYPHEFSGGQRQRIAIARSLVLTPKVLICDEPVSALDLLLQAQILQLLVELQQELRLSLIVITHDFRVVEKIAHEVMVMKEGEIVEQGPVGVVLHSPQHPYTQNLLFCVPHLKRKPHVT